MSTPIHWEAPRPMSEEQRRRRDYQKRLTAALGYRRCFVMMCLGGDFPHRAPAFDPPPGADMLAAFREFVASRSAMMAEDDFVGTRAMAGVARLITGDLSGADEIIDNLPAQPGLRGYCNLLPFEMLAGCLPLPATLGECHTWLAGSPQQAALRQWLDQHRHALRWDEVEAEYRWIDPPAGESQSALD